MLNFFNWYLRDVFLLLSQSAYIYIHTLWPFNAANSTITWINFPKYTFSSWLLQCKLFHFDSSVHVVILQMSPFLIRHQMLIKNAVQQHVWPQLYLLIQEFTEEARQTCQLLFFLQSCLITSVRVWTLPKISACFQHACYNLLEAYD